MGCSNAFSIYGTPAPLPHSAKQQLEAQKRNFEEELSSIFITYGDMIATIHQYHVRIDNSFDKGAVAQHFSVLGTFPKKIDIVAALCSDIS